MLRSTSFRSALSRRLLLAALVPLLIVAAVSVFFVRGSLTEQISRADEINARALVAQIDQALEVPKAIAAPYTDQTYQEVLANEDPERHWQELIVRIPEIESVLLVDDRGVVRAAALQAQSGSKGSSFVGLDRSRDPAVASVLASATPVWSDVYLSPISGAPSLSYVVPLRSGALVVNLTLSSMIDLSTLQEDAVLPTVIDRNGVPITTPDGAVTSQWQNMRGIGIVDAVLSGADEAHGRYTWLGVEYLGSAHIVKQVGWVALASQPWDQAREAMLGTQYFILLLVLLAAVFSVMIARALADRLSNPVSELAAVAESAARGEYETVSTGYREHELSRLAAAFNEMSGAVKSREQALASSAKQYRFLVESLRAIPWEYDLGADRFTYVGPQAEKIIGYPLSAWTDLDSWAQMLHPDDRDEAVRRCMDATAQGLDHNLEYRVITADGDVRWFEDVVSVSVEPNGCVRLIGVMIDISESKEAAQLRVAAEAAEAASHAKSSFLANMSHELRTPLNSILGFGNILLSGLAGDVNDEQERQLGMIVRSGNHLLALVNDVLDLEKIEAGAMEIEPGEFDVEELLRSAVDIVAPLAAGKGLTVDVRTPSDGMRAANDEDRVQQVLLNLFSNAVKFTEHGSISIALEHDGEGLARVTVADTGIGVPEGRREEIFDEFKSMGRPGDNPLGGTGLGLPISRRLARLMGGDVTLSSAAGEGSTFVFTFSLTQGQDAAGMTGQS